jgi:hypothetical protein
MITWQGKTQAIIDWARELDIDPGTISKRFQRGMTVEQAFSRTDFSNHKRKEVGRF